MQFIIHRWILSSSAERHSHTQWCKGRWNVFCSSGFIIKLIGSCLQVWRQFAAFTISNQFLQSLVLAQPRSALQQRSHSDRLWTERWTPKIEFPRTRIQGGVHGEFPFEVSTETLSHVTNSILDNLLPYSIGWYTIIHIPGCSYWMNKCSVIHHEWSVITDDKVFLLIEMSWQCKRYEMLCRSRE